MIRKTDDKTVEVRWYSWEQRPDTTFWTEGMLLGSVKEWLCTKNGVTTRIGTIEVWREKEEVYG